MTTIQPFNFHGHEVRVIVANDGEPRWIASDVAKVLGLGRTHDMVRTLDEDERGTDTIRTPSGDQEMTTITESGLYSAILRSRKPEAKEFKRWVTREVLPAIRKHGAYMTEHTIEQVLTDPDTLIKLATDLKQERARRAELEAESVAQAAQIEAAAPKVEYHDTYVTESDTLSFRTIASTLGLKETELRGMLIDREWIYRETSSRWSQKKKAKVPQYRYSEYAPKKAYFFRKEEHDAPRFRGEVMHTLKITPAGAAAIARALRKWRVIDPGQTSLEVGKPAA